MVDSNNNNNNTQSFIACLTYTFRHALQNMTSGTRLRYWIKEVCFE